MHVVCEHVCLLTVVACHKSGKPCKERLTSWQNLPESCSALHQSSALLFFMQQNGPDNDDDDGDTSGGTDDNACDQDRITLPNLNPRWSCGISVTRSFACAGTAPCVSPATPPPVQWSLKMPLPGHNPALCPQHLKFTCKVAVVDLICPTIFS